MSQIKLKEYYTGRELNNIEVMIIKKYINDQENRKEHWMFPMNVKFSIKDIKRVYIKESKIDQKIWAKFDYIVGEFAYTINISFEYYNRINRDIKIDEILK